MQCEAHHPVRQEVPQDALCGCRTAGEVRQQSDDWVLRRVHASISGMSLKLHAGVGCLPSMKQRFVEQEQMSTYPEGHGRRRCHESG